MGTVLSSPWTKSKGLKVLIVGLDFVGKTVLLHTLPPSDPEAAQQTIATKGYNTKQVTHHDKRFMFWDLSGCHGLRLHWRFYFENAHAVLFVVDPTDTARIAEAQSELARLAAEPQLANARFALLLHKSDLPVDERVNQEMSAKFAELMGSRPRLVEHTSCKTEQGKRALGRVLDWLADDLMR
ncbi:ADP-ribosylation factor family-domain-containing protein [Catenaria anguillulae PL171]|uniref:ADP-ribosylation factor family-domain-containing protein n=1 Tax=Catenaria anguillulae PL171 TaxID=765915 RepID=A0A1Y2I446_9FUNG|nr:ADP-ribosylation factor family-domain-containing protein [Catenaria anguillulae PL171]